METRAVVFDWDGVLCDSAPLYVKYLNLVLAEYGKEPLTLELIRQKVLLSNTRGVFSASGVPNPNEAESKFLELVRCGEEPPLFFHVLDTFGWLKARRIDIFIASGNQKELIRRILERRGLAGYIDEICGNESPEGKVRFVQKVIAVKGFDPKQVVFVDDSGVVIEKAHNVGCWLVGVTTGYCSYEQLRNAGPHEIVNNLKSFQRYINLINLDSTQPAPTANIPRNASGK